MGGGRGTVELDIHCSVRDRHEPGSRVRSEPTTIDPTGAADVVDVLFRAVNRDLGTMRKGRQLSLSLLYSTSISIAPLLCALVSVIPQCIKARVGIA